MEARFSRRGEQPTLFEVGLVNHSSEEHLTEMRSLWLVLGKRIGANALATVLDELGGSTVHVPDRGTFFGLLYSRMRDAQIRQARGDGVCSAELARRFGLSQRQIARICAGESEGEA